MIMTSQPDNPSSGLPPMPVTEMTMEQDFHQAIEDFYQKLIKKISLLSLWLYSAKIVANTVKTSAQWPTHNTTEGERLNLGFYSRSRTLLSPWK